MDSECKRYFNFDGVIVGVLYLLHKYMPENFQYQNYEEMYLEHLKKQNVGKFVKSLSEDLLSGTNNLLKVDKLIDVEMNGLNNLKQTVLIDIEIQNKYQSYYWQRACNYLCCIRSEYYHYLRSNYPNKWIPVISCWFMTNRSIEECPFVIYTPYFFEDNNRRNLLMASISFQYSKYPPNTDDEIELAFYKLLSPYSQETERMEACKTLHCEISEEEVKKMCNYSDVCIMLGRDEGREEERKETIKKLLRKMSVDEIIDFYDGIVPRKEIIMIQNEVR